MKLEPGQIVRFTYNHPPEGVDANTGDRFKEIFVLHPNWQGEVHAIDLKRLTMAERSVISAIMDPRTKNPPPGHPRRHHIPLVNDIVRRMDPIQAIKNPRTFYVRFVKIFLKNKDAYRRYAPLRMLNVTVVKNTSVTGNVINDKPLFHKVESKSQQAVAPKGTAFKPAPSGLKAAASAKKKAPAPNVSRMDLIRKAAEKNKK